ncbi:hypothetical protein EJ04DRAFT_123908 [Polyplosphaeria fusca]|uniref:Uncharacterized protein n=1 Tax=Polyplosphaeria fusca TaxID=682080 RepID=A0A9P4R6B6_9PLEO|nr:hypothetical protein EJ04DRAFT_123908 [Polyplosphaeria fusca]
MPVNPMYLLSRSTRIGPICQRSQTRVRSSICPAANLNLDSFSPYRRALAHVARPNQRESHPLRSQTLKFGELAPTVTYGDLKDYFTSINVHLPISTLYVSPFDLSTGPFTFITTDSLLWKRDAAKIAKNQLHGKSMHLSRQDSTRALEAVPSGIPLSPLNPDDADVPRDSLLVPCREGRRIFISGVFGRHITKSYLDVKQSELQDIKSKVLKALKEIDVRVETMGLKYKRTFYRDRRHIPLMDLRWAVMADVETKVSAIKAVRLLHQITMNGVQLRAHIVEEDREKEEQRGALRLVYYKKAQFWRKAALKTWESRNEWKTIEKISATKKKTTGTETITDEEAIGTETATEEAANAPSKRYYKTSVLENSVRIAYYTSLKATTIVKPEYRQERKKEIGKKAITKELANSQRETEDGEGTVRQVTVRMIGPRRESRR